MPKYLPKYLPKYFLAALIVFSCLSGPARAQDAAAPFDGDLQRLAEILGTLHYLRGICGSNEGGKWRNEMQALIDAETPSGDRRARMIAGFNRGYNGFQQTYRTCTPAASVAIRRYIDEGSKISRDLTARYAN
ncbi:TIGR02301 family protein [Bradyrhizobium sp.]|uniref:TIGR02301 family protein n=1 Tax=Bradyrhizobium sp. TaxID=376 RepID=UPI003C73E7F3